MQLPFLGTKSGSFISIPAYLADRFSIPALHNFIPENSLGYVLDWFQSNSVTLRISKARTSKFGDYRAEVKNIPARISVNQNLNKFDFLITLIHEMAHHDVWTEFRKTTLSFGFHRKKRRPLPHGKEWKDGYKKLMLPLMNENVFPKEVLEHLKLYFENPRSTSKSNEHLVVALKAYDAPDNTVFIETLAIDSVFKLPGGKLFRKQEKLRKRYRCLSLDNGRNYLFSPKARVVPI